MTRDEQLEFCKVCKNQKFDARIGIICSITDRVADFTESCKNFEEDFVLKGKHNLSKQNSAFLNTASAGQRFANYLIDMVFYLVFTFVFAFFLGIILSIVAPEFIASLDENNVVFNYSVAFASIILYYLLFEFILGRTPAKYFTGTKVVDVNGNVPNFQTVLLRTICRFIPFEAFSFLGDDAIGWHDTLSKTRVVNVK